jgi:hypothetical protein
MGYLRYEYTTNFLDMRKVVISKKGVVQWRDIFRGLIMAILTPVFVLLQQSFENGELTVNWKALAVAALAGGAAYILKSVFEPAKVIIPANSNTHAKAIKERVE